MDLTENDASPGADTVSVINYADATEVARIPVGDAPMVMIISKLQNPCCSGNVTERLNIPKLIGETSAERADFGRKNGRG